jgi:hypothetical protein
MVATRCALLATVLLHRSEPADIAVAIERLRNLDEAAQGEIGFRYAFAEFCDAMLAGARDRMERLRDDIGRLRSRSRSMIPVECFLQAVDLPLPAQPTQWLEPAEDVSQRWAGHLAAYTVRHR